jgi:hypothetical protein
MMSSDPGNVALIASDSPDLARCESNGIGVTSDRVGYQLSHYLQIAQLLGDFEQVIGIGDNVRAASGSRFATAGSASSTPCRCDLGKSLERDFAGRPRANSPRRMRRLETCDEV